MERLLGERDIGASHRPVDEVRAGVKALIEEGYWRWLDPERSPDEWPNDEPLPVEETGMLPPPIAITKEEEAKLLAFFGVTNSTEGRLVRLSPKSSLACPAHELELRPDSCRSCQFLADS